MERKLNLVAPMGGAGARFFKNGFSMPKPLIEINGKPFFYWSVQSIKKFVSLKSVTFVVLKEHVEKFEIDKKILSYFPEADFKIIPEILNGAVLTCLKGVEALPDEEPIVFNDCDHLFKCEKFYDFCKKGDFSDVDGALLTFASNDPKFSFVKFDDNKNLIGTVEKKAVSDEAICGAYYFKDKETFVSAANRYLKNCDYSEYFMSGVYNVMVEDSKKIKTFKVDFHLPFGTPEEYELAAGSDKFEVLI